MASGGGSDCDNRFRAIQGELGDSTFDALKQAFLAVGRGKRKEVGDVVVNNKLLLQVFVLKEEGKKSWKETEAFLQKIIGREVPSNRLRTLTEKACRDLTKQPLSDAVATLSFLDTIVDIDGLGPHLTSAGFSRASLLDASFSITESSPTNGLMIDLGRFQNKLKLSNDTLLTWFCRLTQIKAQLPADTAAKLKSAVNNLTSSLSKLQKNSKENGSAAIEAFCLKPFASPIVLNQDSSSETLNSKENTPKHILGGLSTHVTCLRGMLEDADKKNQALKLQNDILTEERRESEKKANQIMVENESLKQQLQEQKETNETLVLKKKNLETENRNLKLQLSSLKKENVVRRLKRIQTKQDTSLSDSKLLQRANEKISSLKNEMKLVKGKLRQSERVSAKRQSTLKQKMDELKTLKEENIMLHSLEGESCDVRLKDPQTGHFTTNVVKCVLELIGENQVSASRCSEVIRTVSKQLFNQEFSSKDLPSLRSVLRFADQGHILAKLHITETLESADQFDLHSDGTTKCGKKVVGQQVCTNIETLSCGFSLVSSENSTTLMDVTTNLIQELADLNADGAESLQFQKNLLKKLVATMSDRAAVNTKFNTELNNFRKATIGTDQDIEFLHCNAHFLLGLANSVSKTLKTTTSTCAIGRQKNPKFTSYSSTQEHTVYRFIRETCDVLGPRGDERYSCRDSWLAYLSMQERKSLIPSFKGNRFNNLFQAAAAIYCHQHDIQEFFGNFMANRNFKQDGIHFDLQCEEVEAMVIAIGILYHRLTLPYWKLLGQPIHYLDFYAHVTIMHRFLLQWASEEGPQDAFSQEFEPLFGTAGAMDNTFMALITISEEKKQRVLPVLKSLCQGFVVVTERQLVDFLPTGKYHASQDPELRQRLTHSKLTNLIGEQCFGDLDFSLFKCRNGSAHYLSTLNMLNRNKTISGFLMSKPEEEQQKLFAVACAKARESREKHRAEERLAVQGRRERLEEDQRKRHALQEKKQHQKEMVLQRLRTHEGPCRTPADVKRMLSRYDKQTDRLLAAKAEVNYHKLVLGHKSPLLKVTLKFPELVANLQQYLTEREPGAQNCGNTVETEDANLSSESDEAQTEFSEEDFSFKFTRTGTRVAVFYDSDYYVGEVSAMKSETLATVNFMERSLLKNDSYRWPSRLRSDETDVRAQYVFHSDFDMTTTNGRIWTLHDPGVLLNRLKSFKCLFC